MTEEEAKTKKCHVSMAPMYVQNMELGYAISASVEPRPCIGSACMAWRVHYKIRQETPPVYTIQGVPQVPVVTHFIREEEIGGYCGIAGKP